MTNYLKNPCKYILDDCDMLLYFRNLENIKIHTVTLIYIEEHNKKHGSLQVVAGSRGQEGK